MGKSPSISCHVVLDSEVGVSSAVDSGVRFVQLNKCTGDDARM